MVDNKSLELHKKFINAVLLDVQTNHHEVMSPRACRLTAAKLIKRLDREGLSFLTKTLPRLGKALDRALSGEHLLDAELLRFKPLENSKLPKLFGELFQCVFSHDGRVLALPNAGCIKTLRQLCFIYYKYELPNETETERQVLEKFIRTDRELSYWNDLFEKVLKVIDAQPAGYERIFPLHSRQVIRRARKYLSRVLSGFNYRDIHPRHGPGVVSTKETFSGKYRWRSISPRIEESYPFDEYYYSSLGHVCDSAREIQSLERCESSARVLLVPKDSRGPRLISCEPLVFQWIQQGLGRALVSHIEQSRFTRNNVRFTDQSPNRFGALLGSITGGYATLDLNEASDRVSIGLVRLLFPQHVSDVLMNCRSLSTTLPDGTILKLNKFAPMGSALCFPVLALTVWALVSAAMPDADSREGVYVYGDDVIVPTAQAANAINTLESFGLLINRDKSCTSGFFRESCGMDAYKGVDVTPVRFRTVWRHSRCPSCYASYIAYANDLYHRGYRNLHDAIVEELVALYGPIPGNDIPLIEERTMKVPGLRYVSDTYRLVRKRWNKSLQRLEFSVLVPQPRKVKQVTNGWSMLLRYFAEACPHLTPVFANVADQIKGQTSRCSVGDVWEGLYPNPPLSTSIYTERGTSYLVRRWR